MPKYVIMGKKILEDGAEHHIREECPSLVKAEWIRASYVEHGYETTIEEATT